MKTGRFIIATDFCTSKISAQDSIRLTIPNSFPSGPQSPVVFAASKNIGSMGESFRIWLESDLFDYGTGHPWHMRFDGAQGLNGITIDVIRAGNTFTLRVHTGTQASPDTYVGYGQTITAHIQTFVSPFQA